MASMRLCDMCHVQLKVPKYGVFYLKKYGRASIEDITDRHTERFDLCPDCLKKVEKFIRHPYQYEAEIKLKLKKETEEN